MASSRRSESPEFTFCDDGGRPLITNYGQTPKFRPGQLVLLTIPGREQPDGPFKVAAVTSAGKYTLCLLDGQAARNGDEVGEGDLKAA